MSQRQPGDVPEVVVAFRLVGPPKYAVLVCPTGGEDSSDDFVWQDLTFDRAATVLAYTGLRENCSRAEIGKMLWGGDCGSENLRQAIHTLNALVSTKAARKVVVLAGRKMLDVTPGVVLDVTNAFEGAAERLEVGDLLPTVKERGLSEDGQDWLSTQRVLWRVKRAKAFSDAAAKLRAGGDIAGAVDLLWKIFPLDPGNITIALQLSHMLRSLGHPEEAQKVLEGFARAASGPGPNDDKIDALRFDLDLERQAPRMTAAAVLPTGQSAFAGRDAILVKLVAVWDAAGAFVLIGEAGSGKSDLLRRLEEQYPGTVRTAALAGDVDVAYGTVARLLRRCLKEWGTDLDPDWQLRRLLPESGPIPLGPAVGRELERELVSMLTRAHARGLRTLLVDDLQFADSASMSALRRCAESISNIRFGFASRPAAKDSQTPHLEEFLRHAAGIEPVEVPPLSLADVTGFLDTLDDRDALVPHAADLLRASGGSPWHVIDLVKRYLERGRPALPFDELAAQAPRLALTLPLLSWQASALLNLLVVAGPDYSPQLAASVLRLGSDALDRAISELESAGLIQGKATIHDLDAADVRDRMDEASQRSLHTLMVGSMDQGASPERLAHHCEGAKQWAAAAAHAVDAAQRSERLGQRAHQHDWLRKAERWYREADMLRESLRAGIDSLEPCIYHFGSEVALGEANRLAALAGSVDELTAIDVQRARIALLRVDFDGALRFAEEVLRTTCAHDTRALATAVVTVARAMTGGIAEAMQAIVPAMHQIEHQASVRLRHELWSAYGLALAHDERWSLIARVWKEVVLKDARRSRDKVYELDVLNSLSSAEAGLGRAEQAMARLGPLVQMREEMDDNPESLSVVQLNVAIQLVVLGRYDEAIDAFEMLLLKARAAGADGQSYGHTAADALAEVYLALGRPDLAAERVAAPAPEGHAGRLLARALLRGRAATERDAPDAAELWREAMGLAELPGIPAPRRERARLMALGPFSRWDEALCEPAISLAREREHVVLELLALMRQTQCRLLRGAPEAGEHARRLEDLAGQTQSIYLHRPEVLLTVAQACEADGRPEACRLWLATGRDWLLNASEMHVPQAFHESFLRRRMHRQLLESAARSPRRT